MCGEWFCSSLNFRREPARAPLRRQLGEAARALAVATIALAMIIASWTMLIALVLAGAHLLIWLVSE